MEWLGLSSASDIAILILIAHKLLLLFTECCFPNILRPFYDYIEIVSLGEGAMSINAITVLECSSSKVLSVLVHSRNF